MSLSEEQVQQLHEGQRAAYLLTELRPIFNEVINNILTEMKNSYRSGSFNEASLLASAAKLCTLEDIEESLRGKISTSEHVAKELNAD